MSGSGRDSWIVEGALLCLAVVAVSRILSVSPFDTGPGAIWILVVLYLGTMATLITGVTFREGRTGARARWEALGLRPRWVEARDGLVAGVVGLVVLGLVEWAARTLAGVDIGPRAMGTGRQVTTTLETIREHPWLAVGVVSTAGVIEEVVFRGWGLLLVRRARPSLTVPALAGSSLLFGAAHLVVPVGGFLHYSMVGLVFGLVALVAGSVVPGALLHGAINTAVVAIGAWGGG